VLAVWMAPRHVALDRVGYETRMVEKK